MLGSVEGAEDSPSFGSSGASGEDEEETAGVEAECWSDGVVGVAVTGGVASFVRLDSLGLGWIGLHSLGPAFAGPTAGSFAWIGVDSAGLAATAERWEVGEEWE